MNAPGRPHGRPIFELRSAGNLLEIVDFHGPWFFVWKFLY